jgi:glycosyltransferase involved in cell wall biosynthesis
MSTGAAMLHEPAVAPDRVTVPIEWHVLTGEYPPQDGGVSDYTRLIAHGLAEAGDRVVVWAPPLPSAAPSVHPDIDVRRLPDRFGPRSWRMLGEALDGTSEPYRLLVQYVPHAFGWKGANVPFCLWLRARRRDHLWMMFHEVAYPFERGGGLRRHALAAVNRLMASLVGASVERSFVSIPAWRPGVEAVTPKGTPLKWLPVPNAIDVIEDPRASADIAARYGQGHPLVGHFGTFGALITPLLTATVLPLVANSDCRVLLIGRGSREMCDQLSRLHPELGGRLHATGVLVADDVSRHIRACTVMMQPYPDGISSRRTSAMAPLAHGVPIVTTEGPLSESVWREAGAVVLVPSGEAGALAQAVASLAADPARQRELSRKSRQLYDSKFHIRHTIAALRA